MRCFINKKKNKIVTTKLLNNLKVIIKYINQTNILYILNFYNTLSKSQLVIIPFTKNNYWLETGIKSDLVYNLIDKENF